MIYLTCFAVSGIFIFWAEKGKGNQRIACLVIGIMIPAVLAGMRSSYVGTDVLLYARQVFASAIGSSSLSWMGRWNSIYGVEYGYLLLNYIISLFTENIAWQFFAVELFILIFIYKGFSYIKRNVSDRLSIAGMFMIYYLLFYNESLNLMRQSMAVAVTIYGFRYVHQRKLLKYLLIIALAMQFHITSLLAVIIYPIYVMVFARRKYSLKYFLAVVSIIGTPLIGRAAEMIIYTGVFGDKFFKYFNNGINMAYSFNQLIIRIPFIILIWYMASVKRSNRPYYNFMIIVLLLDLVFAELRGIDVTLYRLSLYFSIFKCAIYPEIARAFCRKYIRFVKAVIWGSLLLLWYYQIVYMNNGQTYPYMLNIYDDPVIPYVL